MFSSRKPLTFDNPLDYLSFPNKGISHTPTRSEAEETDLLRTRSDELGRVHISDFLEFTRRNVSLPKKIDIFDTILCDGEGTPGVNFALEEKVAIAKALDDLGGATDSLRSVEAVMEDEQGNTSIGSAIGPDIVKISVDAIIEGINRLYRI